MTWKQRLIRFRSFWMLPAAAALLLIRGAHGDWEGRAASLLWLIPLGVFCWTLLEYAMHRFLFHTESSWLVFRKIAESSHLAHHAAPRDPAHILVVTEYALAISAVIGLGLGAALDAFQVAGIVTGIWAGFLYYEFVHYRVHVTSTTGFFLSRQRQTHLHHHYRDARASFGVTTPLWDYVFRTRPLTEAAKS